MKGFKALIRTWSRRRVAAATSVFADTVQAGEIWEKRRRSAARWGLWGGVLGALVAIVWMAPAAWLGVALASATGGRLLLAEARGTVWNGNAVLVMTGGAGSRDATALPGRFEWKLRLQGAALAVTAQHACCLAGPTTFRIEPGLGRHALVLPSAPGGIGQWPAAVLSGLGTPWNTLQLGGSVRLASPGARIEFLQGRWRMDGQLTLDLAGISSRISTLDELGSYRIMIMGQASGSDAATLQLSTLGGSLQVNGQGQWVGSKLRFQGEASAAQGAESALNNLLNIIGRRQGARSVISIG